MMLILFVQRGLLFDRCFAGCSVNSMVLYSAVNSDLSSMLRAMCIDINVLSSCFNVYTVLESARSFTCKVVIRIPV